MKVITNIVWKLIMVFAAVVAWFTWSVFKGTIPLESVIGFLTSLQR